MRRLAPLGVALLSLSVLPTPGTAQWRASAALEGLAYPGDDRDGPDLDLLATARGALTLGHGPSSLFVEPFMLLNLTGGRARFDLTELAWVASLGGWEISAGSRTVAWGVTESTSAVDVINQRLPRATARGFRRLGQLQLSAARFFSAGTLEAWILPGFRERPMDGFEGRLWGEGPVSDESVREGRSGRHVVDWAVRWSQSAGAWDLGLSHFSGRSRTPYFERAPDPSTEAPWVPDYPLIDQTGIDVQWTPSRWLVKLEAVTRADDRGRHEAVTGGLEYAVADYLSLFGEYAFDSRGSASTTSFEHDAFLGARLLTHEADLEGGMFVDTDSGNRIFRLSGHVRLDGRWSAGIELRTFGGDAAREPAQALRQGSLLSLALRVSL